MSAQANYFRIGLFVLIGAGLLVAILILFGAGNFLRPKIYFETYVDGSIQGVDVGSPVKFRGVTIGKVTSINFTFNEYLDRNDEQNQGYNYVVILMEIDKEVFPGMFDEDLTPMIKRNVARGLRVRIEPAGITGMMYLDMNYVDPKRFPVLAINWEPRYYYIPSAPGELTNILDSVNKIMRDLEDLNLQGFGDSTIRLINNMNQAITDAKVGEVSEKITLFVSDANTAIQQSDFPGLSSDARKMLEGISESNERLKSILTNLEPASRLNSDDLNATISNLRIISDNLRSLSADLEQNPSRLIFSRPPAKPKVPRGRVEVEP